MSRILKLSENYEEAVELALKTLRRGGLIVYPTDTAYGLGGDATSKEVVERIYEVKRRSKDKPLSVMVGSFAMLEEWFHTEGYEEILRRYLPGPYTFVLEAKRELAVGKHVGVRMPDHRFCLELASRFSKPIVSTSANISTHETPYSFKDLGEIVESVELCIDGGETPLKGVSTVVDLINGRIIRKGVGKFSF